MTKVSLSEVGEYLEQFHSYGTYAMCICPFHDDHSPSCIVFELGYKCKSCGAKGTLESLYNNVSGRIVIREKTYNPAGWLWKNWIEKFGSIKNIVSTAHSQLKFNDGFASYLRERKIDGEISNGLFGFLEGYYTFPIRDEFGDVLGCVARASPTIQTKNNRYSVSHNCPIKLYVPSWRKVLKDEELYVCYGTLDSWTLHMAGLASITGISGQEFRAENLDRFRKRIFVIPDKNEESSALEIQSKLGWRAFTLFLDFPEGTKDLNGIHQKYGIDTVSELIAKAKEKYFYE